MAAAILIPAILLLVRVASPAIDAFDLGAIVGPVENEWWRYLAAPFVYPDIGYLFVASVGIAIFGTAVEQRLGMIPTAVLILACGGSACSRPTGLKPPSPAATTSCWPPAATASPSACSPPGRVMRAAEVRAHPDEDVELIGAAVAAAVLILLPLVDDYANVFAGLAGALVGSGCGLAAALTRRERHPG